MMFGYAKEELLDRNIKIIMTHPHSEMHDTYLKRYFRTHKKRIIGTTRTLKARHKDGSTFLINLEVNEFMEEGEIMFGGKITRVLSQQGSYSPSPSRTALTYSCVSSHDMHCACACAVVRVRVRVSCVVLCYCAQRRSTRRRCGTSATTKLSPYSPRACTARFDSHVTTSPKSGYATHSPSHRDECALPPHSHAEPVCVCVCVCDRSSSRP